SEPSNAELDSSGHWQRAMQGHAASNLTPVLAANRVGREVGRNTEITFYGCSFICDATGAKVAEANRTDEAVLVASFDLEAQKLARNFWGLFRDRRPDIYGPLLTIDGITVAVAR
ncbi:MAG: N-carbamoylputrescine amidase, partial [Deltaproteobacteria bacterium]|nr:N-carbamoylputrescine amidase [Deltaproteobacteria bacterium]